MADEKAPMLDGIRVIECSLLGPAAITSHLVDFGAEVIKVEAPSGDYVRQMTWPMVNDISLLHLHLNRGKQSLVLDLKVPEAVQVFEELVRESHVVIEAMRPGFLEKRGLGYARLRELNPAIVMCTISGYGATGPYRDLPSHGIAYDTWAGTLQPVIDDDGFCRIPDQANIGITAGPVFGAIGILAALVRAQKTGEGANMEIAQSDAAAYFDWYRIETWKGYDERPDTEVTGNPTDDYERRAPGLGGMWEGVRYQYYEASDGYILFMASEQAFWKNFCEGVEPDGPLREVAGQAHRRPRPGQHRAAGDPARHLQDAHDQRVDPVRRRAQHHDRPGQHAADGPRRSPVPGSVRWTTPEQTGIDELLFPLHVEGEELPIPTMAPTVGEHSDEVLTRVLGYDADKLGKLKATGALG